MKRLLLFEDYDIKKHNAHNIMRKMNDSPKTKNFLKILSLLDDVVHLDFKNIRNTFKNKEGFRKTSDLFVELSIAFQVLKDESEDRPEFAIFYDIQKYQIDVDLILDYLEDENVKAYLSSDIRGQRRLTKKFADVIEFLKKYQNWKNGTL